MCFRFTVLLALLISFAAACDVDFIYNGFRSSKLSLDGIAKFTSNGLLKLTNETWRQKGQAFYPNPVNFKNSTNGSVFSFAATFVFAIISEYPNLSGHGIAFVIAPTRGLPGTLPSQFLGLFNDSNNGNAANHVVAVELDTIQSNEFADINENHVGIDINGLKSDKSFPAGYYEDGTRQFRNLTLISGQRMQVWVEYHGLEKRMDVTLAPINVPKPKTPLLSLSRDLSSILNNEMYVGFSSSTGSVLTSHYVLGWSFKINGQAQELTLSQLPKLPRLGPKKRSRFLTIGLPLILVSLVLAAVSGVAYFIRRKRKFAEVVEDWELEYGPHRFKYEDLYVATKGFKDKELVGAGGFGRVYRGVLPTSKLEIAVKRVSHESRQGMKEFVAEIPNVTLNWRQRFRVIKDPQTTRIVGTLGYLAPEHTRTGKATPLTDVFAFGAFLLEVACGRRPIQAQSPTEDVILIDWVYSCWYKGDILEAKDPKLGTEYVAEEVELVLKLGLLCSHSEPEARPTMRQCVQFLEGDIPLPEISSLTLSSGGLAFAHREGFDDFAMSYTSSIYKGFSQSSSVAESLLSGGR
ncbi:hypothetical protein POUND7_002037 [Theobroma cacao]